MTWPRLCFANVILLAIGASVSAQSRQEDVLENFDSGKHVVAGKWTKGKEGLRVASELGSRCVLPVSLGDEYRVRVEFTRKSGEDVVAFLLPIGGLTAVVELSGWKGEAHGLARVGGQPTKSTTNPTSVRPGKLENGRRYRVDLHVKQVNRNATVEADLDQKRLFSWSGALTQLSPHAVFTLTDAKALGLGVGESEVVFHSVQLLDGKQATTPTPSPRPANTSPGKKSIAIDLRGLTKPQSADWELFPGAQFRVSTEGQRVIAGSNPSAGEGDRGAFLKKTEFTSGSIEVDLKGSDGPQSSFLGVVFHAADSKTYDAVYFRPFNFRSSDAVRRSHAVQYISHPDWPWDRLRREKNGQYERAAQPEPKPTDWFHIRVEVSEKRVRVFVDGADQPSLDVAKLSDRATGKVGLWFNGIAEFSELKLRPAE